jgi:hypothetical protein
LYAQTHKQTFFVDIGVNSRTLQGGENNSLSEKTPNEIAID